MFNVEYINRTQKVNTRVIIKTYFLIVLISYNTPEFLQTGCGDVRKLVSTFDHRKHTDLAEKKQKRQTYYGLSTIRILLRFKKIYN